MKITIETSINANLQTVWDAWTKPEHITQWNFASPDWQCPTAMNDLKPGGNFSYRMEAKDGSMGFDFYGTYDAVIEHKLISITLADTRTVVVQFNSEGSTTIVSETFEAEDEHSAEQQRDGWQAILDNFKAHVESL